MDQFKQLTDGTARVRNGYQYEPVNNDNAMAGAKMAFGSPVKTVYKFDKADRVLSLDADIFSGFNVALHKGLLRRKGNYREDKKRSIAFTPSKRPSTLTGAKADHRLAVKPSQMPEIAKAIAAASASAARASTYTENAAVDRRDGEGPVGEQGQVDRRRGR